MDNIKIKTKKYGKEWAAEFTIGVQTFTVATRDTKEEADWYCKMLSIAFEKAKQDTIKKFVKGTKTLLQNVGKPSKP